MDSLQATHLWNAITTRLDLWGKLQGKDWRAVVDSLGQLSKSSKRRAGTPFSDSDIFEGMLKAVLSNSTKWARISKIENQLGAVFCNYSLADYAVKDRDYIDQVVLPWFKERRSASPTLRPGLKRLIDVAKVLQQRSEVHGSADSYFTHVLSVAGNDAVDAVVLLGTSGSQYKLKGMGIPLAAEAMKNIGYEVAKPDRHICRALGCFGLVSFGNSWRDQTKTTPPNASPRNLVESMRAVEAFASAIGESPSFVDQVIWLLCAQDIGAYLSNDDLKAMR